MLLALHFYSQFYCHADRACRPLMASECCSCMTMRGEDRTVHPKNLGDALNTTRPPKAGGPGVLAEWNAPCLTSQSNGSNGLPYMVGTEVWTLFDYYGESHGWPHVISMYGQFDVVGFAKSAAWLYRTIWLEDVDLDSPDRPPIGPVPTCRKCNGRLIFTDLVSLFI